MGKRWTNEMNSEFRADWLSGMHYTAVAEKYGVRPTNVYNKARSLGLPTRRAACARKEPEQVRTKQDTTGATAAIVLFVLWLAGSLTAYFLQN